MPCIRKENRAEPMMDYAIYIILSPLNPKRFFISKTASKKNIDIQLRKAYTKHVNGEVNKTKALFENAQNLGLLPPIYHLETIHTTNKLAFKKCVAWTKYFLEHGYEQVYKDILTDYACDLTEETKSYYNNIANENINDVLYPEEGLFPDYKFRKRESNSRANHISIYINDDEYKQIKKAADTHCLSLTIYCKNMVLNGRVLQVDLTPLVEYMDELTEDKYLLRQILYNIYSTGNYYPADLKNIQTFVDHISELQGKAHKDIAAIIRMLRE